MLPFILKQFSSPGFKNMAKMVICRYSKFICKFKNDAKPLESGHSFSATFSISPQIYRLSPIYAIAYRPPDA
jgi:hypothetical protein